jgi:hypothetical protein
VSCEHASPQQKVNAIAGYSVYIVVYVSNSSSVTGTILQQVGCNIPLRCIFKPS